MALRFADSFDHYATAEYLQKWTSAVLSVFSTTVTNAAVGRNSTNGTRFTWADVNAFPYIQKTVTVSGSTAIMGVAFKASAFGVGNLNPILSIWDGATAQCSLAATSSGNLYVTRGNHNGTTLGTSVTALATATYYYIEFKVLLHGSTGTYEVRVNGTNVLSGTGANTAASGTAWTAVRIGSGGAGNHLSAGTWDFDDFYVCDGSGANNNDFLGPIRIKVILPDGAGASTDMTPSAGSNFQNVDDTLTDGDTTYNTETTPGDHDTYTYAAVGLTGAVRGVQTNLMIRSNGAGSETVRPKIRISAVDYNGTTTGLATTYTDITQIHEVSPATTTAWTVAEIDGAEFGIELVS